MIHICEISTDPAMSPRYIQISTDPAMIPRYIQISTDPAMIPRYIQIIPWDEIIQCICLCIISDKWSVKISTTYKCIMVNT